MNKLKKAKTLMSRMVLALFIMLALQTPIQVNAAPKTMPDGNIFDPEFYTETYQDVKEAFGTDEAALYNHYLMFGIKEGRLPYAPVTQPTVSAVPQGKSVYDQLVALKVVYPEGMKWDGSNKYVLAPDENRDNGWAGCEVSACQAFAYQVQDTIFGTSAKVTKYETGLKEWCSQNAGGTIEFSSKNPAWVPVGYVGQDAAINAKFEQYWLLLQVGDVIADGNHASIVLTKGEDYVTVVEGNNDGKVKWGREISKDLLRISLMRVETALW